MGRPTHEAPTREYTHKHTQTQTRTQSTLYHGLRRSRPSTLRTHNTPRYTTWHGDQQQPQAGCWLASGSLHTTKPPRHAFLPPPRSDARPQHTMLGHYGPQISRPPLRCAVCPAWPTGWQGPPRARAYLRSAHAKGTLTSGTARRPQARRKQRASLRRPPRVLPRAHAVAQTPCNRGQPTSLSGSRLHQALLGTPTSSPPRQRCEPGLFAPSCAYPTPTRGRSTCPLSGANKQMPTRPAGSDP
mmetsp:Transcript_12157/g.28599  ORF Transcript_12157/g.28599 Transcript_12157/m.28599 type:complete len:243 (+) Transcript_12157:64-792(+)